MSLLAAANGVGSLATEVASLRDALLAASPARLDEIDATLPWPRRSAANLAHYVELRNHDIRDLQRRLGLIGLSSLGRAESSVLATIDAVLIALAGMNGRDPPATTANVSLEGGRTRLDVNADRLLGPVTPQRSTRIMVTLPSEAAVDDDVIDNLVARGMDIARVNCAHDDATAWAQMVARLRASSGAGGRPCRIVMDLGGPKLRKGPLVAGPRLVKISPQRDVSLPGQFAKLVAKRNSRPTFGEKH